MLPRRVRPRYGEEEDPRDSTFLVPDTRPRVRFYTFRSDNATGVSNNGSTFTASFGNDNYWQGAKHVKIAAVRATIWFAMPNLERDATLLLTFQLPAEEAQEDEEDPPDAPPPVVVPVLLQRGIYGYDGINAHISRALKAHGQPANAFQLYADWSTQKINLVFKVPGSVEFQGPGQLDLLLMLGFAKPSFTPIAPTDPHVMQEPEPTDAKDYYASAGGRYEALIPGWTATGTREQRFVAPYHARFDHIQFFNITSNLADGGMVGNGGVSQGVIAQVLINRLPGEQIVYDPGNPIEVDASAFEGAQIPMATFNLLDDKFNSLDTNGQPWTVTIRVREDLGRPR